jgi:hypothetical protein
MAIHYASRKSLDASEILESGFHFSCGQAYLAGMQWANNFIAGQDAIRQRAPTMRATIFHGQKAVSQIENGNLMAMKRDHATLAQRNTFARRDTYPL